MKELYILGASGHGKVVRDVAESMGCYENIRFFDDNPDAVLTIGGKNVVEGSLETLLECAALNPEAEAFVAIGNNMTREKIQKYLEKEQVRIATLIYKKAVVSKEAKVGAGTVVMPGAVINHSAVIGKGCIVNTSSSIDHDNRIGNYCHISVGSHLAGTVTVGDRTMIGIGAVVKNNVVICQDCVIGAGAAVVKDIKCSGTYIGMPARLTEEDME